MKTQQVKRSVVWVIVLVLVAMNLHFIAPSFLPWRHMVAFGLFLVLAVVASIGKNNWRLDRVMWPALGAIVIANVLQVHLSDPIASIKATLNLMFPEVIGAVIGWSIMRPYDRQ